MAFSLFENLFPKSMTSGFLMKLAGSMDKFWKSLEKTDKWTKKQQKSKWFKSLQITGKMFSSIAQSLKGVATFGFDLLGVILQLGNSMGVLQPIMQMLQGVLAIMGGAAIEAMADSLERLAELLFSDDMIEFWQELGTVIGEFMSWMIDAIIGLLNDPAVRKLIINGITIVSKILIHLGTILGWFINWIASLDISTLGKVIYGLALVFAFFKGLAMAPGIAGLILGGILMGIVAVALAPLLALQHGAVITSPTYAMLGEGGEPEMVVPLSRADEFGFGGNNEEMIYEQEETNRKLDTLIYLTSMGGVKAIR